MAQIGEIHLPDFPERGPGGGRRRKKEEREREQLHLLLIHNMLDQTMLHSETP